MGKRGRKPTPTPILALRGSWLAKAREKAGQVTLPPGEPQPPAGLSDIALAEWVRVCEALRPTRVLSAGDAGIVLMIARAWETTETAREDVEKSGQVLTKADGTAYANPSVKIMLESRRDYVRWLCEVGLTPSSRSSLRPATEDAPDNGKARFFKTG